MMASHRQIRKLLKQSAPRTQKHSYTNCRSLQERSFRRLRVLPLAPLISTFSVRLGHFQIVKYIRMELNPTRWVGACDAENCPILPDIDGASRHTRKLTVRRLPGRVPSSCIIPTQQATYGIAMCPFMNHQGSRGRTC